MRAWSWPSKSATAVSVACSPPRYGRPGAAAGWWARSRRGRLVCELLRQDYSPGQTAGRLKRDYPGRPELQVSHETMDQAGHFQPFVVSQA
jgi:transposase, IS30 family